METGASKHDEPARGTAPMPSRPRSAIDRGRRGNPEESRDLLEPDLTDRYLTRRFGGMEGARLVGAVLGTIYLVVLVLMVLGILPAMDGPMPPLILVGGFFVWCQVSLVQQWRKERATRRALKASRARRRGR